MRHFTIIFVIALILSIGCNAAFGRIINVPDDFETIQAAIDASADGDTVLVAAGTYVENISFEGKNIVLLGNPDDPSEVVIDGDEYDCVVFFINEETEEAELNGFTIQNGYTDTYGGGIRVIGASPTLDKLRVIDNYGSRGGGCAFDSAVVTVTNSIIESNSSGGGSGIWINNSEVRIEETSISNNYNSSGDGAGIICSNNSILELRNVSLNNNILGSLAGYWGGGIYCSSSDLTIRDSEILGNRTHRGGGGICFDGSQNDLILENVIISENEATDFSTNADRGGGGILCTALNFVMSDVEIMDNTTNSNGGGISYIGTNISFNNVIINNNTAYYFGGGILVKGQGEQLLEGITLIGNYALNGGAIFCTEGTNAEFRNVAIANNTCRNYGAGVYLEDSNSEFTNVTLSGNSAGEDGGGIYLYDGSEPLIVSSIFWNNEPEEVHFSRDGESCTLTVTYSCIEGGDDIQHRQDDELVWGDGNIEDDPLFVDPDEGDFHLTEDSPCIDAGDPNAEEDPDGTRADMGALYFDQREPYIDIGVNPESLDFGAVDLDDSEEVTLTISNEGNRDLIVSDISLISDYFSLEFNESFVLAEGEESEVVVTFEPVELEQIYLDTLTIHSDDPNEGELEVELTGWGVINYTIELVEGWNMISSPLIPHDPVMTTVWQALVEAENLIIVKDYLGNFYYPIGDFNNLPDWVVEQGYQVKVNDEDSLPILGISVEQDRPIPLREGWSIAAYFPEEPVHFMTAFANIEDILLVAKDAFGRFYLPRYSWGNMGLLEQGQGYKVKVSEAAELVWNTEDEEQAAVHKLPPSPEYFIPAASSGANMSILIQSPLAPPFSKGGEDVELAVFTEAGTCIGSVVIEGDGFHGMAIWGDDLTTKEIDGAVEGEALSFRLWTQDQETTPEIEIVEGEAVYSEDGILVLNITDPGIIPVEFGLHAVYPNPFNPVVTIRYGLDKAGVVRLKVYDVTGREVATLLDEETSIGTYHHTWDASGFPSGIYFLHLKAGNQIDITKIALVR